MQGSGIGPLMFLKYINELIIILEEYGIIVKAFADDVKLYLRIVNSVDFLKMQQAQDALQSWASTWQLTISVKKCCILNIGSRPTVHSPSLSLVNTVLPIKSSVLDLGININVNLSPSERVCCIVARAHKRLREPLLSVVVLHHATHVYCCVLTSPM